MTEPLAKAAMKFLLSAAVLLTLLVGIRAIAQPAIPSSEDDLRSRCAVVMQSYPSDGSYVVAQSVPTIRIPAGIYTISAPINLPPVCRVEGEDCVIVQSGTGPIFSVPAGALVSISGVKFVNGGVAITNNNINGSIFTVRDCFFDRTPSTAISVTGPILSAHLSVTGCRFRECASVLDSSCDMTAIRDVWIQQTKASSGPWVIRNQRGRMSLSDSVLVPANFVDDKTPNSPIKTTWIENADSFSAERVRFSGERGGIPVIRHTGKPSLDYPFAGGTISIRNCQLSCGPKTTGGCVVEFVGCPSIVTIEDCDHLIETAKPPKPKPNEAPAVMGTLFRDAGGLRLVDKLKIKLGANQSAGKLAIGNEFKSFVEE